MKQVWLVAIVLQSLFSLSAYGAEDDVGYAKAFLMNGCPVSDQDAKKELNPFLVKEGIKIVGGVLSGIVDLGSKFLKEAAKDKVYPALSASNSDYLHAISQGKIATRRCLIFYVGTLNISSPVAAASGSSDKDRLTTFANGELLASIPDVYLESRVQISADQKFFRLVPQAIRYSRKASAWGSSTRSGALTISFRDPAKPDTVFASTLIELPPKTFESIVVATDTFSLPSTDWMPLLVLSEEEKSAVNASPPKPTKPINYSVSLVETDKRSEILKFLAGAVDSSVVEDDLKAKISELVNKELVKRGIK